MEYTQIIERKMKTEIINTLRASYVAEVNKIALNVQIMLANPMAIHDHTDYAGAIEAELDKMSTYQDRIDALNTIK